MTVPIGSYLADQFQPSWLAPELEGTHAQLEAVNDFFWRTRERTSRLIYLEAPPERREAA